MNNKKILFFTPSLNIGGIERILLTYAEGLSKLGFSISFVVCHYQGAFTKNIFKNINLINLNVKHIRYSFFSLARVIKDIGPDYIITANEATLAVVISRWLSRNDAKIISSQHSYLNNNETNTITSSLILRFAFKHCYKIIAVSRGIETMLSTDLQLPNNKIEVIYNPIDINRINQLSTLAHNCVNEKYILFVGRLSPVKNLMFLIDSFNILLETCNNYKLIIVGDGTERNILELRIRHLNISDKIIFIGETSNPYPYIKDASVLILPSFSEAFPTILLEGLCLGKTIVSTPTNGAKEILNFGDYGYISDDFTNIKQFAALIKYSIHNQLPEDKLRTYANNYNLDNKLHEISKLFK